MQRKTGCFIFRGSGSQTAAELTGRTEASWETSVQKPHLDELRASSFELRLQQLAAGGGKIVLDAVGGSMHSCQDNSSQFTFVVITFL